MPDRRIKKISISYPPLESGFGVPLLTQNRQFQWFNSPTYIYPIVPASAATLLKKNGFEVIWDDAISECKTYAEWLNGIKDKKPALIAIESKTPVIKRHWEIVRELKKFDWNPVVVLMGDHVTAFPRESMEKSPVDFVLTGGDYDFLLLNICRSLSEVNGSRTELEPGIWYRDGEEIKSTGEFRLEHDLNGLPLIDRDLTKWRLYSEKNGNYKKLPGTYTMAGRDCWWGKCSFCSWTTLYPKYRVRKPDSLLEEVSRLSADYGIKEIMDDTGTFPVGEWLRYFCNGMIESGLNRKLSMNCNMRFGAVKKEDYRLMKKAGFRLLLFGLESANQGTLDRLDKGVTVEKIIESCRNARAAGLYPHITIMFGYPWETYEEALNTIKFGKWLLRKGLAWTVQATIVIPYPGTPLYKYCRENGFLSTEDWDAFDMRGSVVNTLYPESEVPNLVQKIYSTAFNPEFLLRRFLAVRDTDDVRYFFRAAGKVMGHLMDFKNGKAKFGRTGVNANCN
ncbi:MAG: radical SAM protein [Deltaproteobacteria bacterium]|nr:radical SAM protein [Deltaproteobacteria bacterium]